MSYNSKMFKLNKATHMLILMTFTIVFIVVYMYYMIRDVKKIYGDVKKQAQDIVTLQTQLNELKNDIVAFASTSQSQVMHDAVFMAASPIAFASVQQQQHSQPQVEVIQDDETESVATEDIKKLVEDGDVPVDNDIEIVTTQEESQYSEESLKKLKFEEIKDICKKLGITVKGSKESLITKIIEHAA